MKYIHFALLSIFLIACSSTDTPDLNLDDSDNTVLVKASGLTSSVTLFESISEQTHEITVDGNYNVTLPVNQTIYNLEILNSNQQVCSLSDQLDLSCDIGVCTTEYSPVCAKKPLAGVVCVTAPCETDRYLTFGNTCAAISDNAWIALHSECEELQQQITFHQKPARITNIALVDIFSDSFTIITSEIADDAVTVEFEVSGGCGSHDFTLHADEVFMESDPVQLSNAFGHLANDDCDSIIRIEKTFDLLPIKEIYRRTYPESSGENTVILNGLGNYTFVLD